MILRIPYPLMNPYEMRLKGRVSSDSIRSIRLLSTNTTLLLSIIFALIPEGKKVRCNGIESVVIKSSALDILGFFTHYHFPKSQHLRPMTTINVSIWNHLRLHTASLTSLSLIAGKLSTPPTTSRLLSVQIKSTTPKSLPHLYSQRRRQRI